MIKKVIGIGLVVIMSAALVPDLDAQVHLLGPEGFEDGIPDDWEVDDFFRFSYYRYHWRARDWGSNYQHDERSAGVYYGYDYSYFYGSRGWSDEWLITPAIDLTGYSEGEVTLRFHAATYYYYYAYRSSNHSRDQFMPQVMVSTDDGETWSDTLVNLWSEYEKRFYIDDDPNPLEYDLTDYLGEEIKIGYNAYVEPWRNYFYAYSYRYYFVDDVEVLYEGAGGGGRDLACTRVLEPVGGIESEPITPEAVVANLGGGVDSCYAICRIEGPGASYDEGNLEGIVYLDPNQEDNVTFPSWTPPGEPGDQYTVNVTVYLWPEGTTEDDNPSNNTDQERCHLESAVQVDAITVSVPEEGETCDCMNPEAEYESTGSETAEDFYLYCDINSLGYHTEPYTDSFLVESLAPGDKVSHQFAEWLCDDSLPYEARFYAALPSEGERELLGMDEVVPFQGKPFEAVSEKPQPAKISFTTGGLFTSTTSIHYSLPSSTGTEIRIYDAAGKVVRHLHQGPLSGQGTLYWNGSDDEGRKLGSGLYFIRIITPAQTMTSKVVMVR